MIVSKESKKKRRSEMEEIKSKNDDNDAYKTHCEQNDDGVDELQTEKAIRLFVEFFFVSGL